MTNLRRQVRNYLGRRIGVEADTEVLWTPEFPLIYVNNPKAGCSTIKQSLKAAQADAHKRAGRDFELAADPHVTDDCLRRDGLRAGECRERYVFSCVRNPFARALSAYLDKVEHRDHRMFPELRSLDAVSFESFLRALAQSPAAQLNVHFRPQHINLGFPKLTYDAVFFLEHPAAMSTFLAQVVSGFELQRFAPHARGAADKIAAHYDATTEQLVREVYAGDFEAFGYSPRVEDARRAPGSMIVEHRLLPHDEPLPELPDRSRASRDTRVIENAMLLRRLVKRRLI